MRNLIAFLVKNSSWFLFIFLEVICFYFIFQHNSYQRSVYLNSSNELVGRVYLVSGNVQSYFGMRRNNRELLEKNGQLQAEVWALKHYIEEMKLDSLNDNKAFVYDSTRLIKYDFIGAKIINNSIALKDNYITIDRGTQDGVKTEMGVISQQGIIGIVRAVSRNFSVVQPVLNTKSRLSCKVKGTNALGVLAWDAKDYRYAKLEDYPRYEKFEKGDTIVTSGYSSIFPEGIIVGIIDGYEQRQNNDNYFNLKVKLATNFSTLGDVLVIKNNVREELVDLEKEVTDAK